MNRLLLSLTVAMYGVAASAQQYIIVDGDAPILASDVEKITYEKDDLFDQILLPGALAHDSKTTIFSQALQLTGLADTLKTYVYAHPDPSDEPRYIYKSHTHTEISWPFQRKFKEFTVFAETDEAFAGQGITNLEQLKVYAKQVYDEAFPEDAGITDPKDRRNSLNRFVAYHILKHKSTYWYLTAYDGTQIGAFFQNTNLADIAAWYGTLMPHASLKCSYPMGSEKGIYLNHRGLMDGPDKYGKQVRGAMVIADGELGFDHECFNGCYFLIDRVLAYDKTTREDVLGSELWRVDFKTLTPEIMSCAEDLRGNYLGEDIDNVPDDSPNPKNGKNIYFKWDRMENVTGDTARNNMGLVHRRAHLYYWSWQGDEVNIFGDFDMTIKLPALPAGEWEVRMGVCVLPVRPALRIYLNDKVTIDSLVPRWEYYDDTMSFNEVPFTTNVLNYMKDNYFKVEQKEEGQYLVTDVKTGEKMLMTFDPYINLLRQYNIRRFEGQDPTSGETVNWDERANLYREQAKSEYIATLPKIMRGGPECTVGMRDDIKNARGMVRFPLGRITTDGKSDNYLRIEVLPDKMGNNYEGQFDYFELVPKAVFDNQEIPEE